MATKERDLGAKSSRIPLRRYFTTEGTHPFDEIDWEMRDAVIPNYKEGGNAFEQRDVEFPKGWSQNATNIVAQKYFRGTLGTPDRESSVRQIVSRVVDTIAGWGVADVEPDRGVERCLLRDQEVGQLVGEDLGVGVGGEVAILHAPSGDRVDDPADHLPDG